MTAGKKRTTFAQLAALIILTAKQSAMKRSLSITQSAMRPTKGGERLSTLIFVSQVSRSFGYARTAGLGMFVTGKRSNPCELALLADLNIGEMK